MNMADNIEKKGNHNYAMIWNYYNHVGEVKNYFGAASKDDLTESNARVYAMVPPGRFEVWWRSYEKVRKYRSCI